MNTESLHPWGDYQFGKGGPYAWPGDIYEADLFLALCTDIESSDECLECDFYEEEDTEDVREAFKDVTEWPLPYLFASAAYYLLAYQTADRTSNVGSIDIFNWHKLFFVLLTVGEPLFQMIHRNGWDEPNKESIREGFRIGLEFVIKLNRHKEIPPYMEVRWFHEKRASWFKIGARGGRVSPENLLGCLELVSTDETVARLAVKEVFETESLYPFYTALFSGTDTDFTPPLSANDEEGGSMATPGLIHFVCKM